MKTSILGFATSLLLLVSAIAHGVIGWPSLSQDLETYSVNADLSAALAVGWSFGSACMLSFSFIIASQTVRRIRGLKVDGSSLWGIAVTYVLFGGPAFVIRNFDPHFLLFVLTGLLVAAFAILSSRSHAPSPER